MDAKHDPKRKKLQQILKLSKEPWLYVRNNKERSKAKRIGKTKDSNSKRI